MDEPFDTSRAAYESVDHVKVMDKIYETLHEIPGGQTCDELEIALEMRHQTCSASITKLLALHQLFDTGKRRPTRSGRAARVYITVANMDRMGYIKWGPRDDTLPKL